MAGNEGYQLGKEGHRDENGPAVDADAARGDPGDEGPRGIARWGHVGERSKGGGHEVGEADDIQRALDDAEIGGARPAPRDLLNGNHVANAVERGGEGHDDEAGQEAPEFRAQTEIEVWPRVEGQADPRRVEEGLNVKEAERRCNDTAGHDGNDRRPLLQDRGAK